MDSISCGVPLTRIKKIKYTIMRHLGLKTVVNVCVDLYSDKLLVMELSQYQGDFRKVSIPCFGEWQTIKCPFNLLNNKPVLVLVTGNDFIMDKVELNE